MKHSQLKKLIKFFGFPSSTVFAGYVVHLPDTDEFLSYHESSDDSEGWGWSSFPDHAIKHQKIDQALKKIECYDKANAIVAYLLDIGKQYILLTQDDVDSTKNKHH